MLDSLAIIGAGNMAEAIARAMLRARVIDAGSIVAADPSDVRRELFQRELRVRCVEHPADAVADATTILLAVKPQQLKSALETIAPIITHDVRIVSIAAGVPTGTIDRLLEQKRPRIVRAMPNTPLMVGEGAVAIAAGPRATADDLAVARQIFESSGIVIEVSEDKLDAVTAVSGSGPAYLFYLVELMTRAGVANGLTEEEAAALATQTAVGTGRMLASGESAETLRKKVTSPGGTTAAAIESFQSNRLDRIVLEAITAATNRGQELGKL